MPHTHTHTHTACQHTIWREERDASRATDTQGRVLLAVTVWCFCRFYYFAFYVIEHYVDPGYRFSGLWSFALYLLSKRRARPPST